MQIIQTPPKDGIHNHPGRAMSPEYVTIHNTGNFAAGADAKANAEYTANGGGSTADSAGNGSYHYAVDDTEIYQIFREDQQCWHAGNSEGNAKSIGIEICVNFGFTVEGVSQNGCKPWAETTEAERKKAKQAFQAGCEAAAELTADICKRHGWGIDRVVQHNHWSGKDCPMVLRRETFAGLNWAWFLGRVQYYLTGASTPITPAPAAGETDAVYRVNTQAAFSGSQLGAWKSLASAKKQADANKAAGYKVYNIATGALVYDPLETVAESGKIGTVTASRLNVRSKASVAGKVLGILDKGAQVEILSQTNGWGKISYSRKTGYVSMTYISIGTATVIGKVTTDLYLRKGPGKSYDSITVMPAGATVEILQTGTWHKVRYKGKEGYCGSSFIKI